MESRRQDDAIDDIYRPGQAAGRAGRNAYQAAITGECGEPVTDMVFLNV